MKILFDHQIFTFQDYGGISRIYTELYKSFSKNPEVEVEMPINYSNNFYLEELENFQYKNFKKIPHPIANKLFVKTVNDLQTYKKLLKNDFDVFQPTYYDPYFLKFLKKPFVLSVYDMTHEIFPEGVSSLDRTIPWKKKLLQKASRIIAISESTRKDIVEMYGVDESKIDIVYLATSLKLDLNYKSTLDLPNKYILFVGNRKGYKNFEFFVKSVTEILKSTKDLYLVCAGGGIFSETEKELLKTLGIENKVQQIFFKDDKDLAYIYNHALCFVFPSKYEGFGIPVLEGFACETPVLVSNTISLPEVGGDAALYFDPENSESLVSALNRVISNDSLRKELIRKGKERLKNFSWEKTAKGYLDVYESIIK